MSLIQFKSGLLTLAPRVWSEGTRLHIRNNLLLRCLTLFGHVHTVVVDARQECVEVRRRWLWLLVRERRIPFERIAYVDYSFHSLITSCTGGMRAADQLESFRISLVLDDDSWITVCSYRGEGTAMTGWRGVFFGDSAIDSGGNQEAASRRLVDTLTGLLDVPLGARLLSRDATRIAVCEKCDRHLTGGEARCPMCGGRRKVVA